MTIAESKSTRQVDTTRRLEILVVDDNKSNLLSLEDLILVSGNRPTAVLTPSAALRAAQEKHFDLAFLDYSLPQMNGVELAKQLRKCQDDLAFVLISGCNTVSLQRESSSAGINMFFRKPLQVEPILEYLRLARREINTRALEIDEAV